jgi:predicted short-subunit dehydrogenase-like oxidoreductase (DUF2520 family)
VARLPDPQALGASGRAAPQPAPLTIGFIGSGRAASALVGGLTRAGHEIIVGRRGEAAVALARRVGGRLAGAAEVLALADATFLAVPDGAVAEIAAELAAASGPGGGRLVAHLSGSQGRAVLDPLARRGYATAAIHPLQVLSGWRIAPGTTFAVESGAAARVLAARLIADLRGTRVELPAQSRPAYHAAAVLAANLGMTMLAEAVDLMVRQGVPRDEALAGLGALVRGGLEASMDRGLPAALTGPVTRGDVDTVAGHLQALEGDPELRRAYAATSLLTLRQAARDGRPTGEPAAALRALLEAAL